MPADFLPLSIPLPMIDTDQCTGCRRCVEICPVHALDQVNDKAFLRYPEICTYCALCEEVCPTNAIALPFLIVLAPPPAKPEADQ